MKVLYSDMIKLLDYPSDIDLHRLDVFNMIFYIPDYVEYNYFAIDKYGIAYVYFNPPLIEGEIWDCECFHWQRYKVGVVSEFGDWKSTLINLKWLGLNNTHVISHV